MDYNTDFRDFLRSGELEQNITKTMRSLGWSSFLSGFEEDRNDMNFTGFRWNGNGHFPVVIGLTVHVPWKFFSHYGKVTKAKDYSMNLDGGILRFDGEINFTLKVRPEFFSSYGAKGKFEAEEKEFLNLPEETMTIDNSNKKNGMKKMTKADVSKFVKWLEVAVKNLEENLHPAIEKQVGRRFEEIMAIDEEMAIKYAPKEIKDVFIF